MNKYQRNSVRRWWRVIDQQTISAFFILIAFSLMLVTTSSRAIADRIGLVANYFSFRQIIYLITAVISVVVFSLLSIQWIKRLAIIGFIINIFMLFLVKKYGYEIKGATRWISILNVSYQPSEFIKPFFIVVVGWLLSIKDRESFPGVRICLFLYSVIAFFLINQPDIGMLLLISTVLTLQLFIAGMPIIWVYIIAFFTILVMVIVYNLIPYVAIRIDNYFKPINHNNYQVSQSILAFENGGLFGCGPGEGSIKQYLPDSHTDFIFAVAGEEFGAIVCLIIIATFSFIVVRSFYRIINKKDLFIQIAAIGLICQFALQALINIAVSLALLPTKGMTLPFVSYGGSSTFAMSITVGMLLGFSKNYAHLKKYKMNKENVFLQ